MKKMVLISLLFLFNVASALAQNIQITWDEKTKSFSIVVIEKVSDELDNIALIKGLDTLGVQEKIYAQLENSYERIAKYYSEIDASSAKIRALSNALSAAHIHNYIQYQNTRLDSFFLHPFQLSSSAGIDEVVTPAIDSEITFQTSENQKIFTLIPLSKNYIRLVFKQDFGGSQVNLYSSTPGKYVGIDLKTGVSFSLHKL